MTRCTFCDHENPPGATSCAECHAELPGALDAAQQADVDPQEWWSNGHVFRMLQSEYIKYLGSLFVTTLFPNGLSANRHDKDHDNS